MNVGGDGTQKFTIDGHNMTVISNDFTQIVPYETNVVTLAVGQRSDVIVSANMDENSAYWIRSKVAWCSLTWSGEAKAVIHYSKADPKIDPKSTEQKDNSSWCDNVSSPTLDTKPVILIS
jgi:FtsP/CotA-like multicopper oxidase with cupredoxin domain